MLPRRRTTAALWLALLLAPTIARAQPGAPDAAAMDVARSDVARPSAAIADASSVDAARSDAAIADASPADAAITDAGVAATAPPARDGARSVGSVARVTFGLFAILALAVLGAHPRIRAWERRAGLAMLTGSGVPFLALGWIARRPSVGILDDATLGDLRPFMEFGLAWIGFRVGTEFNVRTIDRWPPGTARLMFIESAAAFLAVAVASGLVLSVGLQSDDWQRNALVLGACAAVSAPSGVRALQHAGLIKPVAARGMRRVAALDDVMALLVLALVTSTFRPLASTAWTLPPVGWLFLQVGMGAVLGGLTVAALRIASNASEEFALTLGAIAFTAGMGSAVGFSPLVVACIAGIVVENLQVSARSARSLTSASRMRELERTVYLGFFVIVGAMWHPSVRAGWLLLPVYVLSRIAGKLFGVRAARADIIRAGVAGALSDTEVRVTWVSLMPASAVSIALVVSAQASYSSILRGSLETVVIVGAILSELIFRVGARMLGSRVAGDDADLGALALTHDDGEDPSDTDRVAAQGVE